MFGTFPWWIAVWFIGMLGLIIAHPVLPASLLILSGILFGTTHVVPYGPLGMACFVIAVAILKFAPNKVTKTAAITVTS
jgi:hypothetical protein